MLTNNESHLLISDKISKLENISSTENTNRVEHLFCDNIQNASEVESQIVSTETEETVPVFPMKKKRKKITKIRRKNFPGVFLIIVNETFKGLPKRNGCNFDLENMIRAMTQYDFQIIKKKDLTRDKMIKCLSKLELNEEIISNQCQSVVVAISSHGKNGVVSDVNGEDLLVNEIIATTDKLANLPRIFFIHSCRIGPTLNHAAIERSNFFVAYATSSNNVAFSTSYGSLFLSQLSKVIAQHGKTMKINDLMEEVRRLCKEKMSGNRPLMTRNTPESIKWLLPVYKNSLNNTEFCFGEKDDQNDSEESMNSLIGQEATPITFSRQMSDELKIEPIEMIPQ